MRRSIFALLAAGIFVFSGTSDLRAQEAAADVTEEVVAETPIDVQVVEATIINPGAFEPMDLNVEFSGSGDELAAAITIPEMDMRIDLNDLLISDDEFSFSLVNPGGQAIACTLYQLDDDSYRGDCMAEGDDESAEMTLGAFEK
jgi:hypothetical protein